MLKGHLKVVLPCPDKNGISYRFKFDGNSWSFQFKEAKGKWQEGTPNQIIVQLAIKKIQRQMESLIMSNLTGRTS